MEAITINCPGCNSPLELVIPNEVLRNIKNGIIVKFTCLSCLAKFKFRLVFPTKEDSQISDSSLESRDSESKIFGPIGPRPQIFDIEDISKSKTMANIPKLVVRKLC